MPSEFTGGLFMVRTPTPSCGQGFMERVSRQTKATTANCVKPRVRADGDGRRHGESAKEMRSTGSSLAGLSPQSETSSGLVTEVATAT